MKAQLVENLKDPESAQYRNVKLYRWVVTAKDIEGKPFYHTQAYALCGEINSKNSYGGYVGYRPFYSTIHHSIEGKTSDGMSDIAKPLDDKYGENRIFNKIVLTYCVDRQFTLEEAPQFTKTININ